MSAANQRQPGVVLVVEDDWLIRLTVVEDFRNDGWTVMEAEDAASAIALLTSSPPIDVVFTDIDLRGELMGWDVADTFRQHHPTVAVVYTSGVEREHSRKVESSLFFTKPYNPTEIIEACWAMLVERLPPPTPA